MTGSYRYLGSALRRDDEVVRHGDVIEPTEAELSAFGDLLEPVDGTEAGATTGTDGGTDAGTILESAGIDPNDYREMQDAAREHDDVAGNLSKFELQKALAAKLGGE